LAQSVKYRASHGTLLLVLDDENVKAGLYTYTKLKLITEDYSAENKAYITKAFNDYYLSKVMVVVAHDESGITTSIDTSLGFLGKVRENGWLVCPKATEEETKQKIVNFIKTQRNEEDYPIKAVVYDYQADTEAVVNFTGKDLGNDLTSEQFCVDVACELCGLEANEGITNKNAKNVKTCDIKDDYNTHVQAGELFLYNDGKHIKYSTGVNSLQSIGTEQSEFLCKIRVLEVIDMVKSDLYELMDETIISKYGNSYANRRVVVSSVNSYLKTITNEGYLSNDITSYAELDVEGTREYLNSLNIDTSDMDDKDVLAYKIDSHVFIKVYLYIMDVIEQVQIAIRYDV
jgi:hypothetical protein